MLPFQETFECLKFLSKFAHEGRQPVKFTFKHVAGEPISDEISQNIVCAFPFIARCRTNSTLFYFKEDWSLCSEPYQTEA